MVRLRTQIHDEPLQKFSAHVALRVCHLSTRVIDPDAPAVRSYGTGRRLRSNGRLEVFTPALEIPPVVIHEPSSSGAAVPMSCSRVDCPYSQDCLLIPRSSR